MTLTVSFPWPHRDLSPNARVNHFTLAKRKKAYRTGAGWEALQAFNEAGRPIMVGALTAEITFHPPDNRRRDLDNMLASIKAAIDGIAEVIGCDDSKWRMTIAKGDPVKFGRVVIRFVPSLVNVEIRGQIR
jgi:crossover junction endodeoxyribonuclease RusA